MFSLFNGIYDSYLAPTQMNLLVVGAPSVGKTTLLERLKVTEIPTRVKGGGTGGSKGVSARLGVEDLTSTLHAAFVETGAQEVILRQDRSSAVVMQGRSDRVVVATASETRRTNDYSNTTATSPSKKKVNAPPSAVKMTEKKRFSFCPAPERYLKSKDDDDDGDDQDEVFVADTVGKDEEKESLMDTPSERRWQHRPLQDGIRDEELNSSDLSASDPPRRMRCHSKEFDVDSLDLTDDRRRSSMESIPLDRGESSSSLPPPPQHGQQQQQQGASQSRNQRSSAKSTTNMTSRISQRTIHSMAPGGPLLQASTEEYHLKPKSKMLPLKKIRPTIGTNLGKLDMYGTKCHVFDVGGRLQDLWERYYDDCDAVIFCWKMGEDPDKPAMCKDDHAGDDDNGDGDDGNGSPNEIYRQQQEILHQVRKAIPDDVPFLIFGHIFGHANVDVVDRMYSTDLLLPHYHNPMTGLCCGSAKTGAGVQSSMDWLIPLAKRQQKERLAARRQVEEKEL